MEYNISTEQFFNGTVLKLSINCEKTEDCNETVQLKNRINLVSESLSIPEIEVKDICADEERILIQTKK